MRREWTIWLGFTAVVLIAVVFVVSRDDQDDSKLSAGTSVPTSVLFGPTSTVTTKPPPLPTSTVTTATSSTTVATTTAPATTARTAPATNPGTAATTPPTTAPAPTAPPPTDPPLKPAFGPGLYRINVDLPAGAYRSEGGFNCYWERLSSVTNDPSASDVIANGYSTGAPITVVIAGTDAAFRTFGCDTFLGQ